MQDLKNIYGFDGSDKAVRMARRLTGLNSSHIKKHDIYDSNSAVFDSTFDVVCCLEVLNIYLILKKHWKISGKLMQTIFF